MHSRCLKIFAAHRKNPQWEIASFYGGSGGNPQFLILGRRENDQKRLPGRGYPSMNHLHLPRAKYVAFKPIIFLKKKHINSVWQPSASMSILRISRLLSYHIYEFYEYIHIQFQHIILHPMLRFFYHHGLLAKSRRDLPFLRSGPRQTHLDLAKMW